MKRILFAVRWFFIITILFVGLKANSQTIDNWGVVGSATPNGWGAGPDIPLSYNAGLNTWSAVVTLTNGEIKFRNNNDWAVNYGDNGADGSLDPGGSNIAVNAGTYLITLDFTTLSYSILSPSVSIPDPNFEQALIDLGFDKDGVVNASVLRSDVEVVTDLNVNNKNINSLQGIEAFKNLSRLFCQNNQIQLLDISKNTALTILECGGNQLTALNVTKNLLLKTLGFGFNNISTIDVSKNLNLGVFWCNNNKITSQNLDLNSALTVVGLSNNPLTFVSLKNGNNVRIVYFEAYNTPGLACINSDAVVPVSMTNSGKTFSENCAVTSLAGRWIIAPETGALKVGPAPGSGVWWSLSASDLVVRACYMDDKYVFGKDGSFKNVLGSATFLEPWQGVASDQCGTPVAPHNGADASYVYDQNAGTITLNGKGAYLGLPKVTNSYYLPNGPVPNSITYNVAFSENGNVMTLSISLQGGFWTYKLIKESLFKTYYVNDNASAGDLFTTATGNNANAGTKAAPFATLTHALSQAGEGDTVYVDAGGYAEQVIINKGITIIGAGQTFTSFTPPATALVPAPGPFTEIGLFETTQGIGDVHIRDLSINSINGNSQNIIIQSGGSVKNCTLLNGGQGIFFRIESGTKTALVENNTIQPNGIGINCQGSGLTATIRQNTIFSTNGYYAGIFAGLDFGPIVQLTAKNNIINNYFGNGLLANSFNSNFKQNSIVGLNGQGVAIQQFSGATANATCNWFGSPLSATVATKITGGVTYSPWLIDGTDASPMVGFQPSATCPVANSFYVNDNNTTGDVFTTAVGNNANLGTFNAPFATLDYAYSQVPAGATIFVDAGTYDLGGLTYSFPKAITFLGANYQVSPNDASNKLLPNATRNAESIFTNGKMQIASNDISIEGFTWDVGNRTGVQLVNTALTNNDFGNFRFLKNIYKITHTNVNLVSFSITGKFVTSPAMPVTSGFTIEDNRFEKSDTAVGTTFNFNYVKNILIKNNSFVVTGSTFRRQQIANLGNSGIVELYNFSDNVAENAGIVVNCNRVASGISSGNKLINSDRALNVSSAMPESSSIEFSNNIVETTIGGSGFVGYNRTGTSLPGTTNTFRVENNIFTGVAIPNVPLQLFSNMIFTIGNSVLNPSFLIRGNKINYSGDFSLISNEFIRPITVRGNVAELTIESNEVVLNNTGSSLYPLVVNSLPPNPAFTINTDFNSTAFMPANAVINILNNKVLGFKQSVVFYDATTLGRDSYQGYGNLPAGATVNLHNNSFTGDSVSINNGSVGASISATCNWYGTAAAQTILTKVSSNSAQVLPYLTNGTDTDAATGFQPTANTCDGSIPLITLNSFTNATCFGAANGSINITASFGKAPFVFTWTKVGDANFISNNEDPTNFAAGTYRLAITDANGTTIYKTSMESAAPGIIEVTIAEPTAVTASITNNSTACSNIATVAAGEGTPGYTYLWSNGSTSETISDVPVGTYTVTITDANGCTATASITLTVAEAFNPSASVTNITCFGTNNGIITITNVNGTAPFMFSKDGGVSFESGSLPYSFGNLAPGIYNIAVKDASGCTGFVEKTVTQPTALTATIGSVQSTCYGGSTGAINITVTGGAPAYSYNWTGLNGSFSSSQLNISGLAAGSYTLTVTDKNNCITTLPVIVPSISEILINETVTNVTCRGAANGSITVGASGGTNTSFSYLWNTGATTTTINNLAPGNYSVRVTDNGSGCFVSKAYSVTQPASVLALTTIKTNATGCNSLGTITGTGSGGTAPYTYNLNGGTYGNSGLFTGLYAGSYTIGIMDARGCTTTKIVAITDNGADEYEGTASNKNNTRTRAFSIPIETTIYARIPSVADSLDWYKFTTAAAGNYTVTFSHPNTSIVFDVYTASGTTPLIPLTGSTSNSKKYNFNAGTVYNVKVYGGLSYICYSLNVSAGIVARVNNNQTQITENKSNPVFTANMLKARTYPNPHSGSFMLNIESPEDGNAKVELFNINGQKLVERTVLLQKGENNLVPFKGIGKGTVLYRVQIGKHVATGKVIGIE